MSITAADTSQLRHEIKHAVDLRAGDHVWNQGEVEATFPESRRVMYVEFASGAVLPYNPKEKVLCDEG